tara:strand:- start:2601 stop:2999 length:399 start_codon:yes stop_codon:yes gene_type:complete
MESMLFANDTNALNGLWFDSHKSLVTSVCVELGITDKNKINETITKLLGDRPKTKKVIDPNKPKRGKSSYLFFCDEKRKEVVEQLKCGSIAQSSKVLGQMWAKVTPKEKIHYQKLAANAKELYLVEMDKYNA